MTTPQGVNGYLRGQLIKLYLIVYLLYRFLTEFIRPEPTLRFGLTGYQWACLALVPVFAALWVRDRAIRDRLFQKRADCWDETRTIRL